VLQHAIQALEALAGSQHVVNDVVTNLDNPLKINGGEGIRTHDLLRAKQYLIAEILYFSIFLFFKIAFFDMVFKFLSHIFPTLYF